MVSNNNRKKNTRRNNNSNSKLLKKQNSYQILIIVLIIIIIFIVIQNKKTKTNNTTITTVTNNTNKKKEKFNSLQNKKNNNEQTVKVIIENNTNKKNELSYFQYQNKKAHERIINPLLPPERSYENTYGIPINVPSRGITGSFQQIGALYKESIESENQKIGNNTDSVVLALYGKQTYPRSNKWTYYTSSDANHQVKMPLSFKGKKCDAQYGCDEIMNDDLITIPGYNGNFRVVIYDYDAPKYIPCV